MSEPVAGASGGASRRSAVVILNPLSGRGRRGWELEVHARLARDLLAAHGFDVVVRPTTRGGDAHAFASEARGAGAALVVAWGGDGTVNEAASALVHSDVPLGIVPAGSGNGLAADLGIPVDPRAALLLAATAAPRAIDAGQVQDALFFNIAGVGIDAVIAARFATRGPHQRGLVGYLQLSGAELLRYRAQTYAITLDGVVVEQRALLVAFANGRQYGNRLLIAPGARLDDGLLEVVIVSELSLARIAWRLPSLFRGTLRSGDGVAMSAAREVSIASAGPIAFHVDGEPRLGTSPLAVRVHKRALQVKAPADGGHPRHP